MPWKVFDREYDVVVVGGGPAGSMTAKSLAERGMSVVLFEKRPEIGTPKRCGEGISSKGLEELGLEVPDKCISQEVEGGCLFAPNGKKIEIMADYGGYILERKGFDKWLASEAAKAGAKVVAKADVVDVLKENEKVSGVVVEHMGERCEVKAKVVVAADGVESLTARRAGFPLKNDPKLFDSGFQYEMAGVDVDEHMLEFYLGNDIAERGYIWIFPKGNNTANVGIGIIGTSQKVAKELLDEFIQSKPELSKGSILEVNAGGVPVGGLMENMVSDGLVLVGDAAHQVVPIHGGGLVEAMSGAKIAGEVISEAVKKGDCSQEALSKYNKVWWKEKGNHLKKIEKVRKISENMSDDQMNILADALSPEDVLALTHGKKITVLTKILAKYGWKRLVRNI